MNAEKNIFVEREVFEKDGKSYFSYFIRGNVRGKDVRVAVIPHLRAQGTGSFAFSQSI